MPLRPETRRRRKKKPPRSSPTPGRAGLRADPSEPAPVPAPRCVSLLLLPADGGQRRAGLVQRCLMAVRRNQAHAQVQSAREAGGSLAWGTSPALQPSPRAGALNRLSTIFCMLHYVQAPSPRGTGRRPLRVLCTSPTSAPRQVVRVGVTGAWPEEERTQTCGGGTLALRHKGCSEGRAGALGAYIQRRVEQINKASQEGAVAVQAGELQRLQLKVHKWGVGPPQPGTEEGNRPERREVNDPGKGREEKEFNTSEREGGDLRRSPKDCESCQQGLLLPRRSPSFRKDCKKRPTG